MKLLDRILGRSPRRLSERARPRRRQGTGLAIRGRFDAAQRTDDNTRHWANVDFLSPDAAASADVRRTLRARARYEVANNSYARGIVETLANDLVGPGPRLQMLTKYGKTNTAIEREFEAWAKETRLAEKLRIMRMARAQDGEAFAMFHTNRALEGPVQLDLRLIEAEQIATPYLALFAPLAVDGIRFDTYGNPVEYHLLKHHPGDPGTLADTSFDRIPAKDMIHWFKPVRPGQSRGLPDLLPALPLFAQLRRYTLAVLAAAETAADWAAVLHTDAPPDGEAEPVEPMDVIELEQRMLTTLPAGWDLNQIKAEQPPTTYDMAKREILSEIARCMGMPINIASYDSSRHTASSGRLDHQLYRRGIKIEQGQAEIVILDPIFGAWLAEAKRVPGLLNPGHWLEETDPHQWFWQELEELDPRFVKAEIDCVTAGLQTEAQYYARRGFDWQVMIRQRADEAQLRTELGLPQPWDKPGQNGAPTAKGQEGQAKQDDDAPFEDEVPVGHDGEDGDALPE